MLELRALDGRTAKLQRCEEKYIRRLKRSMTLSGLVEVAEEAAAATKAEKGKKGQKGKKGGGGEEKGPKGKGGGAGEIPKKAMVLIRLEQDRLERLEETVRRAEEKVVAQRDALRAAAQAFEEEKRAILAEHQEVMRVQEEAGFRVDRAITEITLASWPGSIGQPRSSKSTFTWAEIGSLVASVSM